MGDAENACVCLVEGTGAGPGLRAPPSLASGAQALLSRVGLRTLPSAKAISLWAPDPATGVSPAGACSRGVFTACSDGALAALGGF